MRLWLAVIVLFSLVAAPASAQAPSAPVKLLTYNIQGLPAIALNNEAVYGMSDQRRGHEIAARLKAGDYDIIALQEVFDEDVRNVLVADLRSTYPNMIEKLAGSTPFAEDSGLMLLSKFPIEARAFTVYTDRGGSDALADKGIGFARLRNTRTSETVNVFLTHMQADDPAANCPATCAAPIRAKQVRQQIAFMNTQAPSGDTYLLGDLNISAERAEYRDRMADYSAAGLEDIWYKYTSPKDRGITESPANSVNGPGYAPEKLDYVLHRGNPATCFLHQRLERYAFEGMIEGRYVASDLSDHYGIAVLAGNQADRCSPVTAGTHPADGSTVTASGTSWFRFPEGGTYSLSSPGSLTVFEADNLTDPVAAFEGNVYAPRSAFYVKVTGDLYALRHTGTTQADALVLSPSKAQIQTQTAKTYYRVHQRKLTSGAKQAMRFTATGPAAKIRLGALETPTQPNATLTLDPATSPVSGEEQNLSFTVEGEGTFEVRWDSSYSRLSLRHFKVVDQNDVGGVDEPHLYVRVDGGAEREINLGDQDEGQAKILPAWSRDLGFADTVTVRLSEEDGGLNGGWDDYGTRTITPGATQGTFFYLDSSARYELNYTVAK